VFTANLPQALPRAGKRALIRDLIAGERNALRAIRQRRFRSVRREHDHDVVAGVDERTERPVEEGCAVDRLDYFWPTEASGGPTREEDPRGPVHAREISTTAL
jgi:hypothetical protein